MTAELILQGDSTAAVVQMLLAATEVSSITTNISTNLIGYDRLTQPLWVLVERHGGNITYPYRVERPRIDVACYAQQRDTSHNLAQICQAVIFRAAGNSVYTPPSGDCHITGAKIETGVLQAPDKDDAAYRHIFSLRFSVTPR